MFRFNLLRLVGIESDIVFRSVSKDRNFLKGRISQLGVAHASVAETGAVIANQGRLDASAEGVDVDHEGRVVDISSENNNNYSGSESNTKMNHNNKAPDTFSRRLTQQELNRFTTSLASKENLHNQKAGTTPSTVVDENGNVEGQSYPDPTRYGDWDYNGRCYDF